MGTTLGLTKRLGGCPLSLLPFAAGPTCVCMLLLLGQSSSSSFPAGSVDFGPDVTSSDKSIKVLLNAQDKVSFHMLSRAFPPLSLRREWLGAAGSRGSDGAGHRDQCINVCIHVFRKI